MRTIKKKISNAVDLDTFIKGLMLSVTNPDVMYYDYETEMWESGSLVKLEIVADLYAECARWIKEIWGFSGPKNTTMLRVYIGDDRCMLQLAHSYRRIDGVGMSLILLDYNFTKGYVVCDICEASGRNGVKYCYCVTLLGSMKLLTDWCYDQYAVSYRHDYFLESSKAVQLLLKYADYGPKTEDGSVLVSDWKRYELDTDDILSGGPVLCGGKARKVISK